MNTCFVIKSMESMQYFPYEETDRIELIQDKLTNKEYKEILDNVLRRCRHFNISNIYTTDSSVFKILTKARKVEPYYGSALDCKINGFENIKVIISINPQALIYSPKLKDKLQLANNCLISLKGNNYKELGKGIVLHEYYPDTAQKVSESLHELLKHPALSIDIETNGLSIKGSKIVSIAFSWNQHSGVAMPISEFMYPELKEFFIQYKGKTLWHNCSFDISHIIWNCFMSNPLDTEGMILGLHTMFRDIHDTKIIAYLATNSTEGNDLSLKNLALEFAGNYALLDEEHDPTKHDISELLKYNLIDTLATWYVFHKYYPVLIDDNQLDIYDNLMIPSLKTIVQMQLVGMPMDYESVLNTSKELHNKYTGLVKELRKLPVVKEYEWELQRKAYKEKNQSLKKKWISLDNFKTTINVNSDLQVSGLLYEYLGLPVLDTTDNGNPSTSGDSLNKLLVQLNKQCCS